MIDLILQISAGVIGLIVFIILLVIPARLKKINKSIAINTLHLKSMESTIHYTETFKGVNNNYLESRTCVRCGLVHSPSLMIHNFNCPHCGLSYRPKNVIYRMNNKIYSHSRSHFVRAKKRSPSKVKEIQVL